VGGAEIAYTVVRSRQRRKTLTITVTSEGVRIAAPQRATRDELRQAVAQRAPWILKHLALVAKRPAPRSWLEGESISFLGRALPVCFEAANGRLVSLRPDGHRLVVSAPEEIEESERRSAVERVVTRWLQAEAATYLSERTWAWSEPVGAEPSAVLIRDQKRRWGSCSADRRLRFNWRLIMAPPDVVDYVVVHELAHLRVPNHSAAFWAEVERVLPDYRARRHQLQQLSPTLTL
jgi:predicted metal-dependent hydrolase